MIISKDLRFSLNQTLKSVDEFLYFADRAFQYIYLSN